MAGLYNAAEFDSSGKIHGDATDRAVLRSAESSGGVAELGAALPDAMAVIFEPGDLWVPRPPFL